MTLAAPPPAYAGTVDTDTVNAALVLAAGASPEDRPDVARTVTATQAAGRVVLSSEGDPITITAAAASRCRYPTPSQRTSVNCDLTGLGRVAVLTGAGADTITVSEDLTTVLCGGPGNDRITGGPGTDFVSGAAGNDTLSGGAGDDVLRADRESTWFADRGPTCSAGDTDAPQGDTLRGDEGGDVLLGDGGGDMMDGGPGTDHAFGRGGNDRIHGADGDDHLAGFDGVDRLEGGPGADEVSGGAGRDRLIGGDGDDTLGLPALITVDGLTEASLEDGDDRMDGGAGDDTFFGGPANRTSTYPPATPQPPGSGVQPNGADSMYGGDGRDHVSYVNRDIGVLVRLNDVRDDGAPGERDRVAPDVEDVTGGSARDMIYAGSSANTLDGGPGPDHLSGGAGDDVLRGGRDIDDPDTLFGSRGNDTLDGGPGPDRLNGADGNDGIGGPEELGDDRLRGGTGSDVMNAGPGNDELSGESDNDSLNGGLGADRLSGGDGNDLLSGDADADEIRGGPDSDVIGSRDATRDDPVSCGVGGDFAIVDADDRVLRSATDRCEQLDDGRQTQPSRGKVYVEPGRCTRADRRVTIRVPSVPFPLPLGERDAILLKSGSRRRAAPTLEASQCTVRLTATSRRGRVASAAIDGDAVRVSQDGLGPRSVTTVLTLRRPRCASSARVIGGGRTRVRVKTDRRPGRWAVHGTYSTAASVGTDWTTTQTCRRTTTRVRRGRVRVYDRVLRRAFIARPGRPYVARAR